MRDYSKAEPLGDNLLIKVELIDREGRLVLAQRSAEAKRHVVVASGPECKYGLRPGDVVMMAGVQKVDWDFLPGSHEYLVIKEANALLRLAPAAEGGG